ncbi:MAG TPA: hypothetical protein VJ279_05090, partial [Hanamia sp.]|nr:hypothetical protein [Hanamia sp.]
TTVFDVTATKADANAAYFGIKSINNKFPSKTIKDASGNDIPNPKYAEWAKGKSEQEIGQAQAANTGSSAESRRLADQTYEAYSKAISKPEYRNADGTFNKEKFLASEEKLVTDIYKSGEAYNAYNTKMANPVPALSNEGVPYNLPTNYNPEDYKNAIIPDLSKVEPTDLMTWKAFSEFGDNKVVAKSTHTGEKSQNQRSNAALANARTISRENNANALEQIRLRAKLDKENAATGGTGKGKGSPDVGINNPASLFYEFTSGVMGSMNKHKKDSWSINPNALDPVAYNALGVEGSKNKDGTENSNPTVKVTFKRDGTYYLTSKDGTNTQGTMSALAQQYINIVPAAQGIQQNSENGFRGLTGKDVWEGLKGGKVKSTEGQDAKGMSDEEYQKVLDEINKMK